MVNMEFILFKHLKSNRSQWRKTDFSVYWDVWVILNVGKALMEALIGGRLEREKERKYYFSLRQYHSEAATKEGFILTHSFRVQPIMVGREAWSMVIATYVQLFSYLGRCRSRGLYQYQRQA